MSATPRLTPLPRINCAGRWLELNTPVVMGILNVTPDSFSDGGMFIHPEKALQQADQMAAAGAKIIDVGGESTRPGAQAVSEQQELERVIPVVEALHRELDVIISIDTSKAKIMRESASAGAGLINDVMALRSEGALEAALDTGLPVCLMHMQGKPRSMQQKPQYSDVVTEVINFLQTRISNCIAAGMNKTQIIIDPGFGFGKSLEHNIELFKHLNKINELGYPVLVGASRKSMLAQLTGKAVDMRLGGSLALATIAVLQGAKVIRVHDVAETVDAVKVASALKWA